MATEDVVVRIIADDSEIIQSFDNVASRANELNGNISSVSESISEGFNSEPVAEFDSTVSKADKSTKKIGGTAKRSSRSMSKFNRGAGRGVSVLSRFTGVGGQSTRALGSLAFALAGTPFGAFAVAAAAATVAYSAFSSTVLGDSEAIRKENEKLKESIQSLDASLSDAYREGKFLEIDNKNISEAEKNLEKIKIIEKDRNDLLLEKIEAEKELRKARNKRNNVENLGANARLKADEKVKKAELELNRIVKERLLLKQEQLSLGEENAALEKDAAEKAKKRAEDRKKRELDIQKLFDSLISNQLQKRLTALEREAEKREERAKSIIRDSKSLNAFLRQNEEKLQRDLQQTRQEFAEAEQKARQGLLLQLAKDEEEAAILQANAAFKKREKEIETLAELQKQEAKGNIERISEIDAETAALKKSNEEKLQSDLQAIRTEAATKRKEKELSEADELFSLKQAKLEAEIQKEQAIFNTKQLLEQEATNFTEEQGEEKVAFEAAQARERETLELNFQKRRLELALSANKALSVEQKEAIEEQINFVNAQLNSLASGATADIGNGKKGNQGFAGLFGLEGEDANKINAAAKRTLDESVKLVQEAVQARIDALQKEIDFRNKRVNELQNDLQNEIELAKLGKAANVKQVQEKLEAEKAAREKAQADKEAAAKAQFAIDTAVQASSLITAIAQIYSSISGIPFVGVALATALSGVLIGSFIAGKAAAAQAAGFYEGTEHVGKALGSSNATFSGKDGYLGTAGNKMFRFDGRERILNPSQNALLGDMTNDDLVANALIGASIPSMGLFSKRKNEADKEIQAANKAKNKQRYKAYKNGVKEGIMQMLKEQKLTRKAIENKAVSWQVGDITYVEKDGKKYKYKQK